VYEPYAQYFQIAPGPVHGTRPIGQRFKVNQHASTSEDWVRKVANSSQHTIAYAADGTLIAVYETGLQEVYYTIFPPGYDAYQESLAPACCKGDMNADGYVNGLDIQGFLDVWGMEVPACESLPSAYYELFCPADLNGNGMVDDDDIWIFVDYLLSDEEECAALRVTVQDCSANGMLDAADLYYGTSEDCNGNLIPDGCELGNGFDCNNNNIPDECDIANEICPDEDHNNLCDGSCYVEGDPGFSSPNQPPI
jgi:hypothetical protein